MDNANTLFHYHLKWTPERKIQICKGSGLLSHLLILSGPHEPNLPEQPITKQEFYALMSSLAAQGFMDNLLDF
jgi:hypothetical protein